MKQDFRPPQEPNPVGKDGRTGALPDSRTPTAGHPPPDSAAAEDRLAFEWTGVRSLFLEDKLLDRLRAIHVSPKPGEYRREPPPPEVPGCGQ